MSVTESIARSTQVDSDLATILRTVVHVLPGVALTVTRRVQIGDQIAETTINLPGRAFPTKDVA